MTDITLTLRLFGAFREYGQAVAFTVPQGATASQVKAALGKAIPADPALIADSALADDNAVLPDDATFAHDAELAVLPPVCGG